MVCTARFVPIAAVSVLAACGGQHASSASPNDAGVPDGPVAAYTDDASDDVASDSSSGLDAARCVSQTVPSDAASDASNDAPQPIEAGVCVNGWLTSDPGCPCSLSGFSNYCTSVGIRCFVPAPGPNYITTDQLCVDDPSALMPLWEGTRIYTPDQFAALPNEIVLDTSDCSSRSSRPCACGLSGTTESFIGTDTQLWQCTYGNPMAYVAFTDSGCASRIRYGTSPMPDANYVSCLTSAYASRRWDCASTGTHFVMSQTVRPLGGP